MAILKDLIVQGQSNFIGIPTAPTAPSGTSNTQIATTEFVNTLLGGVTASSPWEKGSGSNSAILKGGNSTASGNYSVAEGRTTEANGYYSHAEGYQTTASSDSSHAEGMSSMAIGSASHAEGASSIAIGHSSHAEGGNTKAINSYEHASGRFNISTSASTTFGDSGNTLFSVGNGSNASTKKHNAIEIRQNGDIYIVDVDNGSGDTYDTKGMKRLQDAFLDNGPWENGSGSNSAVLKGGSNTASGNYSVAEGQETIASGESSHAEGYQTIASGIFSHAEGESTKASGYNSHAEGLNAIAIGYYSHAEGANTSASGESSHAEGFDTTASGESSHAEGEQTIANGDKSHAEGYQTEANGTSSHAEGFATSASGNYSHAEGRGTEAINDYEHASGRYNISTNVSTTFGDSDNTLFSVGNGSNASTKRHNAFEIRQNGDIYIVDVDGSGTSYTDKGMLRLQDCLFSPDVELVISAALNDLNDRIGNAEELLSQI